MKTELVFIPLPAIGHIVSAVQLAKFLLGRDEELSITVLIFKFPYDTIANSYMQSLRDELGIRYVEVVDPTQHIDPVAKPQLPFTLLSRLIETQKPQVKNVISNQILMNDYSGSSRLAGFVVDTFCTSMIDVANEFEVPTYVFYASAASMIGFRHHIQSLVDDNHDIIQYKDSEFEFSVSTYANPVPAKLCPSAMFVESALLITEQTRRMICESKGILVNSFVELESHAIQALTSNLKMPTIYPVGPLIKVDGMGYNPEESDIVILRWLDDQPPSSVIFFSFGSFGCFEVDQVKEIAYAIEQSGSRFLWSLRRPPPKERLEYPSEYENYEEVLPEGFLKRTSGSGLMIGWAPQARVLAHPAVGGFVTHCGWNSVLESVWFGVPMAAWPMYSEQQINAFLLVKELGIAAEIKMDYKSDTQVLVRADEIEGGIRNLMQPESEIRKKVRELKEKARNALVEGGSSYISLGRLIEDFHGSTKAAIDPN